MSKNQSAVIITAASRRIGGSCAQVMAERGYKLALMARSEDL